MIVEESVQVIKKYIAEDGTEFGTENQCLEYERKLKLDTVWLVQNKKNTSLLSIEAFSTKELAQDSLKYVEDKSLFDIKPVLVDGIIR